jgi:DNA-binding MarR family transcriptional regulator
MTSFDLSGSPRLERSTLTRNLKSIFAKGWVEEVRDHANGRSRPIALTAVSNDLLLQAEPKWLAAEVEATALLGRDGMITIVRIFGLFREGH